MAPRAEEGRGKLRKAVGSRKQAFDLRMSEWGNPADITVCHRRMKKIVRQEGTR